MSTPSRGQLDMYYNFCQFIIRIEIYEFYMRFLYPVSLKINVANLFVSRSEFRFSSLSLEECSVFRVLIMRMMQSNWGLRNE